MYFTNIRPRKAGISRSCKNFGKSPLGTISTNIEEF